jgi:hypothetical protein
MIIILVMNEQVKKELNAKNFLIFTFFKSLYFWICNYKFFKNFKLLTLLLLLIKLFYENSKKKKIKIIKYININYFVLSFINLYSYYILIIDIH